MTSLSKRQKWLTLLTSNTTSISTSIYDVDQIQGCQRPIFEVEVEIEVEIKKPSDCQPSR